MEVTVADTAVGMEGPHIHHRRISRRGASEAAKVVVAGPAAILGHAGREPVRRSSTHRRRCAAVESDEFVPSDEASAPIHPPELEQGPHNALTARVFADRPRRILQERSLCIVSWFPRPTALPDGGTPMDSRRSDDLPQTSGPRFSRRTALQTSTGIAGMALTAQTRRAAAQDATPATSDAAGETKLAFLFVQLFDEGTWTPKPDDEGVYLLTLTGAAAQTLFFSDRPERIVGTVETPKFLDGLGFTPANPPNAALVVYTPDGERDVLVIELFNPVYTEDVNDPGNVSVTYEARALEAYHGDGLAEWVTEQEDDELPAQFSDISLFIDDCPDLTGCYEWGWGGARVGDLPGQRTYGQCWNLIGACQPDNPNCGGPPASELARQCNEAYPAQCENRCKPG